MIKDPRNFLWIVPLVLLLAFPLWKPLVVDFLNPEQKSYGQSPPSLHSPRIPASSEMDGVRLEQSRKGIREWSLTAERLRSSESDSSMEMEDVHALFFHAAGKDEKTRIISQKARYDTDTKQLILQGNVMVKNLQGYEMQTESLEYIDADRKIRTTAEVSVKGKNLEVTGKRLLYDIPTGNYSIAGNVVCRVW